MSESLKPKIEQALLGTSLAELGAKIEELAAEYGKEHDLNDLVLGFVQRQFDAVRETLEAPEQPDTVFSSVYEFVDEFLVTMYPYTKSREREVRWTQYWWAHEEALTRITVMWHRFEQLMRDEPATGLETFLHHHSDYHMQVIMAPEGVFDDSRRVDTDSIPLPSAPIPTKEETYA
ncbi:DUF4913 domain-containing protein [Corynebacterium riegelii]|uniref:DUF4913 domain-containing protein n=1 Tax=Corynebacterium riegelii TaxID=156976 RepID=UPI0028894FC4|nr:DUF4913 domain-containing protein [Corynebacterium riegelii]